MTILYTDFYLLYFWGILIFSSANEERRHNAISNGEARGPQQIPWGNGEKLTYVATLFLNLCSYFTFMCQSKYL